MMEIFSGAECCVFQSGVADRWMVVKRNGPWFRLRLEEVTELARGATLRSSSDVVPYRLPVDLGNDVRGLSLASLLSVLGVTDRYEPDVVEYEAVDYYPPKLLLEYVARAPLRLPHEAVAFLTEYVQNYTPVSYAPDVHTFHAHWCIPLGPGVVVGVRHPPRRPGGDDPCLGG
ncbi:hypothetical protein [Streptomyces tendae]|uniref:hypothetical protein n=1 Tax=Streptomyces tendae TaxID=1932 RepID=UPI0037179730